MPAILAFGGLSQEKVNLGKFESSLHAIARPCHQNKATCPRYPQLTSSRDDSDSLFYFLFHLFIYLHELLCTCVLTLICVSISPSFPFYCHPSGTLLYIKKGLQRPSSSSLVYGFFLVVFFRKSPCSV